MPDMSYFATFEQAIRGEPPRASARHYSFVRADTNIRADILVRPDRSVSIRDSIAPAWSPTTRHRAASALRLYRRAIGHTPGVYTLTRERVS